jgi:hypothetical protein
MHSYTMFFFVVSSLRFSSGFSAHHQELKNCICNIGTSQTYVLLSQAWLSRLNYNVTLYVNFLSCLILIVKSNIDRLLDLCCESLNYSSEGNENIKNLQSIYSVCGFEKAYPINIKLIERNWISNSYKHVCRDSSVGIVTLYGVWRSGDWVPVGDRFSAPIQNNTGAHPAYYTMGAESIPGVKRPGRGVDQPPI